MKKLIYISITVSICAIIISCNPPRRVIHIKQEYISLKLLNGDRYRYLYYNVGDTVFNYRFNVGRYSKNGKLFSLFPDSINSNSFPITLTKNHNDKIGEKIKIHISTEIKGDYVKQYEIHLLSDSSDLIFHSGSVDTLVSNLSSKNFKVRIDLASKFKKGIGNQLPTFTYVISNTIALNTSENDIFIFMPVSFSTYFYEYRKQIDLLEKGLYWETNGRQIPMRDVRF